jgi:Dynamin GTPase effector domain
MIDMVPKAITLTLVNHSKENLQRELLQELYKPDVLEDLLKESELVVARRKEVVGMVQALNKAEECVLFLFPYILRGVRTGNNSLFTGLWRVSEGGLPIPFIFVLSTYLYITPCLTARTLIIPVLDLDISLPSPLLCF